MRKKIKIVLFVLLTIMSLCTTPAFAVTREDALEYANKKIGTTVGNGQCVKFVQDYYKTVFGEIVYGNGSDYINNVPEGFKQIRYGSNNWAPMPGDIVSWSWNKYGGNNGHTGIITCSDSEGFYYLDQSPEPYKYPVKESRFNYGQSGWTLAGVVRPPFEDNQIASPSIKNPLNKTSKVSNTIVQLAKKITDTMQSTVIDLNELESGSFSIKSVSSEKRMNVYADKISQVKNGTAITLHKETGGKLNDTQYFTFKKSADNTYLIQPRNSNYTVNVSARKSGSKVICWTSTKKNNEEWIIEFSGSGYTFRLKNQPNLYLTQSGDSLKLQKKTGNDNQLFFIQAE